MVRTQIYLTQDEHVKLGSLSRRCGKKRSELIREALDGFFARESAVPRTARLAQFRGLWRDRSADKFAAVRSEIEQRFSR
jgi:hypothetical protein